LISKQLPSWEISVGSGNEQHEEAKLRQLAGALRYTGELAFVHNGEGIYWQLQVFLPSTQYSVVSQIRFGS